MNKMRRNLINLRWNLIKYIQFDGFINDVMCYFYLVAVMVGKTRLTGFSYFRKEEREDYDLIESGFKTGHREYFINYTI